MTTVIYCYRPSLRDEARIAHWMASRPETATSVRDLTPDRPELVRALAGVRAGAVHLLAACRLADLGLAAPQLGVLLDEFAASGAVLAFVIDPIDPMTPDGRRLALFLADSVEAQRRVQAERQRDDLDRARAAGKRVGGRPAGRLAQVFGNLLNNAAKYTEPGAASGWPSSGRGVMSSWPSRTTGWASRPTC
jgi:DNA invertase Pin-like site-specific DNA recombinase